MPGSPRVQSSKKSSSSSSSELNYINSISLEKIPDGYEYWRNRDPVLRSVGGVMTLIPLPPAVYDVRGLQGMIERGLPFFPEDRQQMRRSQKKEIGLKAMIADNNAHIKRQTKLQNQINKLQVKLKEAQQNKDNMKRRLRLAESRLAESHFGHFERASKKLRKMPVRMSPSTGSPSNLPIPTNW